MSRPMDEATWALFRVNEIEGKLLRWRLANADRDVLIREAAGLGLVPYRIGTVMGISPTTVRYVLDPRKRPVR